MFLSFVDSGFIMPMTEDTGGHIVFVLFIWNFTFARNFWMVDNRIFILQMRIPCEKTFIVVQKILILWTWPLNLVYTLKNYIKWGLIDTVFFESLILINCKSHSATLPYRRDVRIHHHVICIIIITLREKISCHAWQLNNKVTNF